MNEEGKYVLPLFPSKIIPFSNYYKNGSDNIINTLNYSPDSTGGLNIIKKNKRKLRKNRNKKFKLFNDKGRKKSNFLKPLRSAKYPSIYSIRPTYRFTYSPSASKTRYCDCCDHTNLPSLREQLFKWSHDLKFNLYEYSKRKL